MHNSTSETLPGTDDLHFDFLIKILLFFTVFTVYLTTMSPDLQWLDSSELQAIAVLLGIGHPPGEPLFSLVHHFSRFLPMGSLAFRVTLVCACCGTVASILIYDFLVRITRMLSAAVQLEDRVLAAGASLFFSFRGALWIQSIRCEVYALNFLLSILIIDLTITAIQTTRDRTSSKIKLLYMISFLLGLSAGNHSLLIALLALPIALILYLPAVSELRWKGLLITCLLFISGLSVYLYLPFRATTSPAINWGHADSLNRTIWMVSGKMFQKSFHFTWDIFLANLRETLFILMGQVHPALFFLGMIGLWFILRKKMTLGCFLVLALVTNLLSVITQQVFIGTNPDILGYLLLSVFVLVVGIYSGLSAFCHLLRSTRLKKPFAIRATAVVISGFIATTGIAANFKDIDKSKDDSARRLGRIILGSVQPDGFLITSNIQTAFICWYLQFVERYRDDVVLIHNPFLQFDWYLETLQTHQPRMKKIDFREIRSLNDLLLHLKHEKVKIELGLGVDESLYASLLPKGMLYEFATDTPDLNKARIAEHTRIIKSVGAVLAGADESVEAIKTLYWYHYCNGIFFASRRQYDQARWEFDQCLAITPRAKDIQALIRRLDHERTSGQKEKWNLMIQKGLQ